MEILVKNGEIIPVNSSALSEIYFDNEKFIIVYWYKNGYFYFIHPNATDFKDLKYLIKNDIDKIDSLIIKKSYIDMNGSLGKIWIDLFDKNKGKLNYCLIENNSDYTVKYEN